MSTTKTRQQRWQEHVDYLRGESACSHQSCGTYAGPVPDSFEPEKPVATPNQPQPDAGAGLCTLNDCPPGLFRFDGTLCFKSEYGRNNGQCDAYVVSSGEYFWGGTSTPGPRGQLLVTPLPEEQLAATPAPQSAPQAAEALREALASCYALAQNKACTDKGRRKAIKEVVDNALGVRPGQIEQEPEDDLTPTTQGGGMGADTARLFHIFHHEGPMAGAGCTFDQWVASIDAAIAARSTGGPSHE
jgi:hypothetical protein